MRYVVWGIGANVESAIQVLGIDAIDAFVDTNPKYIGTKFLGRPVLSYEEFKDNFSMHLLVITFVGYDKVIDQLKKDKITRYIALEEIIY